MQKYTVEITDNGTILWYKIGTGIFHRENGPAAEYANGEKHWYKNGERHREDGPAVTRADDSLLPKEEYWLNNYRCSEEQFFKLTSKSPADPCDGKEVIIEGKTYILKLVDK